MSAHCRIDFRPGSRWTFLRAGLRHVAFRERVHGFGQRSLAVKRLFVLPFDERPARDLGRGPVEGDVVDRGDALFRGLVVRHFSDGGNVPGGLLDAGSTIGTVLAVGFVDCILRKVVLDELQESRLSPAVGQAELLLVGLNVGVERHKCVFELAGADGRDESAAYFLSVLVIDEETGGAGQSAWKPSLS